MKLFHIFKCPKGQTAVESILMMAILITIILTFVKALFLPMFDKVVKEPLKNKIIALLGQQSLATSQGRTIAEQEKLQAEFEKERILTLANASATERIIAAEGEAASRLIIAEGTAESIRVIAENVGMNLSEFTGLYLTLEALKEIAKTTKSFVVIMGQDDLTYLVPLETEQPQ